MFSSALLLFFFVLFLLSQANEEEFETLHLVSEEEQETNEDCSICGKSGSKSATLTKVINGVVVRPVNKYPWIVPLLNNGSTDIKCGGAVISRTFILTAAHCVLRNTPQTLVIGIIKTRAGEIDETLQASEIIKHPNFTVPGYIHDLALLKLKEPLRCDKYTAPVCMPQKKMSEIGKPLVIAGYGRTFQDPAIHEKDKVLREGRVRQVDPVRCQETSSLDELKEDLLCTVSSGRETSCQSDSGSSLFGDFSGVYYSLGVTSLHSDALYCPLDGPVTFANTFAYMEWIKSVVEDLPTPPDPKKDDTEENKLSVSHETDFVGGQDWIGPDIDWLVDIPNWEDD